MFGFLVWVHNATGDQRTAQAVSEEQDVSYSSSIKLRNALI